MTIAHRAEGSAGAGVGTVTPGNPTGMATGDGILIFVSAKPDTVTIVTPTGWTLMADVAGGGGTTGDSVGPTRQAVFFREKDASWSTMPTVTVTGGNVCYAVSRCYSKAATSAWSTAAATGTFGSAGVTTNGSTTLGSNPGITAGDMVVVGYSNMDDAPTWSARSISATGISAWGTPTNAFGVGTATGNDVGANTWDVTVTTGTASAAPVTGTTLSAAGRGTVALVRLREAGPAPTTITGTQATETDVAQAGTVAQAIPGGQAAETSTAFAGVILAAALILGGQAVETDEAFAGVARRGQIEFGGQATETDQAFAGTVTAGALITGDQATETDEAFAGSTSVPGITLGGQALETDTARPGTIVLGYGATDTANRAGGRRRGGYAVATWDPPIAEAPPTIVLGEAFDKANAHGPVTMNGTQAVYDVETATKQRHRDRIIVGGKDVTYWRDVRTPLPTYQLVSPLLYGPATLRLPQVAAAFEQVGVGDLSWLQPGKPVKVQRVDPETGAVAATDYKGVVIAFNASGRDLTVELGGEASGRAALMEKQVPIFRSTHDIGQIAAFALMPLKVAMRPHRGPTTGIKLARFGGTGWLDYISQLCARAWTRSGTQWTIMPAADGVYEMHRKDTTTVDATAYLDDARTVADLRRDIAEEPNRIFVTGITPEGQRVMFAVFPGLLKTYPAPYPFHDGRTFGAGTTDADTATGDGITIMVKRLNMFGIIDVEDAPGGFDADVTKAIRDLQEDAELPVTGDMNPATWRRLYDLDVTGYTLRASAIEPAAQKSYTRPWLRSPSGGLIARNPNYDPRRPWVDRVIDLGSGFTKSQMREFARAELDHSEDNWLGTLTFHTGALVAGSHGHSFTPTTADVFRARRLKPGMNIRLPHSPGGDITVHVSAVSVDEDGKVTATVDTRARDSMAVWEVIERNRESRRDPARQWIRDHRASGQIKDAIDGWWAPGGKLGNPITVPGHTWTVVELIAGQEGTVQAIRMRTNPNAEYVMAVFGKHVHPKRLTRLIGNPLTKRGTKRWTDEGVRNQLDRSRFLLYVAGDDEQPLGYYPKTKRPDTEIVDEPNPDYDPTADPDNTGTDDEPTIEVEHETGSITPLTGRWEDAAGFSYRTFAQPVIYVAVYADRDTVIPAGRVMWPQLEAGA